MEENNTGNPSTADQQKVADDAIFGSSENFFGELEQQSNGGIADEDFTPTEETQDVAGPNQSVTQQTTQGSNNTVDWDSEDNPYKKRYSDSTREAQRLNNDIKDLKPFVPVLEAMKNDSGLVDHVRSYLVNGGSPTKTVQEQMNLPEDFEFDGNEAVTNPDSDSAKVFNAQVDAVVNNRVGQILQSEKAKAAEIQQRAALARQEQDFRQKHNMSDEQYKEMVEKAKTHTLTLEDIHYLINRDKVQGNVAKSTKDDMVKQMKNVRNMPTSASGANSQGDNQKNPDDSIFDKLLGTDSGVDNLFG
jgi:anthranilate/para-aminobenzoate synthase component I